MAIPATKGNLRSVNLNLLPILRELIRKRNVTHAAAALNMSQSGASDALRQLRLLLHDDILAPRGREFVLTSYAERIAPIVEDLLEQAETLFAKVAFDPQTVRGVVKISTVDYVVLTIGPQLIERMAREAPHLSVQFIDLTPNAASAIRAGELDFMISTIPGDFAEFEKALLFEDEAVCLVNPNSTFSSQISEEQFWAARHASYSPGEALQASLHSTVFRQMGKDEFNAVIVDSFALVPFFVASVDCIATSPRRLAARYADIVRIVDIPFPFPRIRVFTLWDKSRSTSAFHRWFREILSEIGQGLDPPPEPC